MKKIIICSFIFPFIVFGANAQTGTMSFDVDGIKVIFRPTIKESVSVRIFFKGGVENYQMPKAGIERVSLTGLFQCGTKNYSADNYKDSCDKYHILTGVRWDYDFGNVSLLTVSKYFDIGWNLFSEAVLNPVFNSNEVERLKSRIIASLKSSQSSPESYLETMEVNSIFPNTPYATNPSGTEESIASLTPKDIQAYYHSIFNKDQMFIVIAGNLTKDEIVQKVHSSFANIPSIPFKEERYTPPVWKENDIKTEKRNLAINYIAGIMNAPQIYSNDYLPFRMALAALSGAMFANIRSKLSLSYDPGTKYVLQKMPYCVMSLSTTQPQKAMNAMVEQVNFIKNNRLSNSYLEMIKNNFIVTKYLGEEASVDITANLGLAEILGGWENEDKLPDLLEGVTTKQIQEAFDRYANGIRWVYLGN